MIDENQELERLDEKLAALCRLFPPTLAGIGARHYVEPTVQNLITLLRNMDDRIAELERTLKLRPHP